MIIDYDMGVSGTSASISVDFFLCEDDTVPQNCTADQQNKTSSIQNVYTALHLVSWFSGK